MSLKEYQDKRNFSKTPEPKGEQSSKHIDDSIFVVQKHDASHLHYDFRLEIEGVLKSWAIPKGLPEKVRDKKLAIETEDHPLEYANFAGTIPEGEYGGGNVEIWDKGTFGNITKKEGKLVPITRALRSGHVNIWLKGKRLNGEFILINFKKKKKGGLWLIIKKA